ncbi:interleukin-13 receptor subunit alpha-2-like isoform X2 [Pelodiscus sinensis]
MDARGIWAVLLALAWLGKRSSAHQTSVERPCNLQIIDPGLLGFLHLEWLPPPSLPTLDQCTVKYKLKYRSTGDADWQVVFTKRLKFGGSFDLGRGAEARVQTLLSGRCVNGSEVQSDWTHATFPAAAHGDPESQIRDFHCVYHNWEQLTCTWRPGPLAPPGARYQLYYWYEGLAQAAPCSDYIQQHGGNVGCNLQCLRQAEYTDFSICVNGSSEAARLRPAYFTFHLQNLVKPSPPEQLSVSVSAHKEVHVEWRPPTGAAPPQCLDYEVQLAGEAGGAEAAWAPAVVQGETTFAFSLSNDSHVSCVRVRGKTSMFCADTGFWSDWAHHCIHVSSKDENQLIILTAVVLSFLALCIGCVFAAQLKNRKKGEKNTSPPSPYLG